MLRERTGYFNYILHNIHFFFSIGKRNISLNKKVSAESPEGGETTTNYERRFITYILKISYTILNIIGKLGTCSLEF